MVLPAIKKGNWGERRSPKRKRGKLDSSWTAAGQQPYAILKEETTQRRYRLGER